MKNYLICVTKRVDKIIGIKARNEKESKEKVVKQIVDGKIDFDNASKDEIHYEIGEFYSDSLEKKLKEVLGEMAEEKNKKFVKLTEEIIEKNKEEQIKVSCKKCRTSMLLDDIIHQ
jgi:hypothetical protein